MALDLEAVREHVRTCCFPRGDDRRDGSGERVGIELEWLAVDLDDETVHVGLDRSVPALAHLRELPGGSRITHEPGGQIELSGPPSDSASGACAAMEADVVTLRSALAPARIGLLGRGFDPSRPQLRVLTEPRYDAMARYFAAEFPAGLDMMCRTASVQVNIDVGPPEAQAARWHLAHALNPVLAAAFANSPGSPGHHDGWRSARMGIWLDIDRTRTVPAVAKGDPIDDWTQYLLDARVMMTTDNEDGTEFRAVDGATTFRQWMTDGIRGRRPTIDDLHYHQTTVFPPVRARGWLELRMVDALPDPWWKVPVAVAFALMVDPDAAQAAAAAATPVAGWWREAGRDGLTDADIARAAIECFDIALKAMPRLGEHALVDVVDDFAERFVRRHRSPADDLREGLG